MIRRLRGRLRRYRFFCPYCNGIFFTVSVSMDRRANRLPRLRSLGGEITCQECGLATGYDSFVRWHRGWERPPAPVERV